MKRTTENEQEKALKTKKIGYLKLLQRRRMTTVEII